MNEEIIHELETIQHKLEELHSMLETAKNSEATQPMSQSAIPFYYLPMAQSTDSEDCRVPAV